MSCFGNSRARLRAERLFIQRVAWLDRARLLVGLGGAEKVVVEIRCRWHQLTRHCLPLDVVLSRWQNALRINVVIGGDIPLGVESAVGGGRVRFRPAPPFVAKRLAYTVYSDRHNPRYRVDNIATRLRASRRMFYERLPQIRTQN